jgi:phosphate starvation-inducible protein PhoH and related proteins
MVTKKLKIHTPEEAVLALGPQDRKLRKLERELKVKIYVRHEAEDGSVEITISGAISKVDKALKRLQDSIISEEPPTIEAQEETAKTKMKKDAVFYTWNSVPILPRSKNQQAYVKAISENDLTISVGPAGTGKTFLAVATALRALEQNKIKKIVLTRPIVESGEKLGYLPGDMNEKVYPYLKPIYDAFYFLIGPDQFRSLREDEAVEIVPLAYMRGRTLENSFIILDEAQNTLPEQMKMFLTRMGMGSKIVVTGDITQIDLKPGLPSGLIHATKILENNKNIRFINFSTEDITRHPLVKEIVKAYEDDKN